MAIEALYRTVRSHARQLSRRDSLAVIWAYSQFLQLNDFLMPRDIEVAPQFLDAQPRWGVLPQWRLEQIAREVIRYGDEEARGGRTLKRWGTLAHLANTLRDLENEIYRDLVGGPNIHLELMRVMHRQFVWQQQRFNWTWIIRYYKLFNTPALNAHAERATGLSIDQIYLIGMCYLGHFSEQPRWVRRVQVELPGLNDEDVDRFLAFTCVTRSTLAEMLRAEHALDEGFAYRYSSLRAFPIIQLSYRGVDEIACPVPTLLFWRITTGLYYSLRDQAGFPTAFGDSFQAYTGEVLRQRIVNPTMRVLDETEYRVGRNRKDSIDWIVQEGDDAALFVECKTMRLTWASKSGMSDLTALAQDIRKLAGAVLQVYKAIRDYRGNHYLHLPYVEARQIYPIVLTLEDWHCCGLYLPTLLDEAVRNLMQASNMPLDWLQVMPYAIISIDEFETAAGVTSAAGIHAFWSGKLEDAEIRRWPFRSYCNDRFAEQVRALPDLFRDEYEAMFADIGA
ncbi:hypothetical protein [Bradyrhizobium sp. SYSU BS000235]|uniref:hypothetical protein n=1 Tax=Bradyrhizobium sp. SYSU BS000235 TaxID=3411332 RepID=UPI003C70A723